MFAPWRSQNPVCKTWVSDYWKIIHYVLTAKFSQKQILTTFPNFLSWNFEKEIAFCESTGRELSFEWPQHRILSADSKVTFTLQNSTKHSGSERVKSQIFFWVTDITKISSKSQQAALPITIFWVIFAGIALKKTSKSWANIVSIRVHPSGAPNVNFRKISVRKTIWDLEFSKHLL